VLPRRECMGEVREESGKKAAASPRAWVPASCSHRAALEETAGYDKGRHALQ